MRLGHIIPPTDLLDTTDIYISREISIEHPSVGLASLAQLLKYVILTIFKNQK